MVIIMLTTLAALMAGVIYLFREARKAGRNEAMVREVEKDLRAWEEAHEILEEMDEVGRVAVQYAVRYADSNGLPDDGYKRADP